MEAACAHTQHLRRVERIAYRLRFAMCLLLLAMTVTFAPAARWLAGLCVIAGLAWSVTVMMLLRRPLGADHVVRLASLSLRLDVALALATYVIFLPDPAATPVALLPLLVFRLAVRYDRVGAVIAVLVFAALLTLRVALNLSSSDAGAVRLPMLLAWLLTAAVVLVLALALSAEAGVRACEPPPAPLPAPPPPAPALVPEPTAAVAPAARYVMTGLGDGSTDRVHLTRREREVLLLLGAGLSSGDVGDRLGISASTVRNHVHNMREKFQVDSRADLMALAVTAASPGD